MKKTTIIPIIAALLLTASCTKVLEFDGTETESMPVLISQPEADSTLNVRLTYSRFFLSRNEFKPIDNATFRAELNGSPVSTNFSYDDYGLYHSDLILRENDTLTLHVIVPDKGEMTAGCRMPNRPQTSDLTIDPNVETYSYPDWPDTSIIHTSIEGNADFHFKLHDPAGQNNYYMIRAYLYNETRGTKDYLELKMNDDLIFDGDATDDYFDLDFSENFSEGTQILFSDERINGHTHTINGTINWIHYQDNEATLHLEISSLSRDYYLFTLTKRQRRHTGIRLRTCPYPHQCGGRHRHPRREIIYLHTLRPHPARHRSPKVTPHEDTRHRQHPPGSPPTPAPSRP